MSNTKFFFFLLCRSIISQILKGEDPIMKLYIKFWVKIKS